MRSEALRTTVGNGFIALEGRSWSDGHASLLWLDGHITHQEMTTITIQACNMNYHNAPCTISTCVDAVLANNNYGTDVAHALHFGFMSLEPDGCFKPRRPVTIGEAAGISSRVADFAGI